MAGFFQEIRGNRSYLFWYVQGATLLISLWLLATLGDQSYATAFKMVLIAVLINAFLFLFWGFIYANQPFNSLIASILSYLSMGITWLVIYPAVGARLIFEALPILTLLTFMLLFEGKKRTYLLSVFFALFIGTHGILMLWGKAQQSGGQQFFAQATIFMLITGGLHWLLTSMQKLDQQRRALSKERLKLRKKTTALEKELKKSRQHTEILYKDMKKKDFEIQNILYLSDQLKIQNDILEVLKSFLLTAIGQIGSAYAFIMAKENREDNYLRLITQKGLRGKDWSKLRLYLDSNLIEILYATREPTLANQIPRETLFPDEVKFINQFNEDLLCPIFNQEGLVGILVIGKKITGKPFSKEDVNLGQIVANQTAFVLEQTHMANEYKEFYTKTMRAMLHSLENRYKYSKGHNIRTANYVNLVSRRLGLTKSEINNFTYGALLHDIGKVVLNDKYLLNSERFEREDEPIKLKILEHAVEGSKILRSAGFNQTIIDMALHHHEFYNGKGYPHRIGEDDLELGTKILSVCNAFDAMTSDRPYRKAMSREMARDVLQIQAGKQFDPEIVQVFLEELDQEPTFPKL